MKYEVLRIDERRIIEAMNAEGAKPGEIAKRVGKCQATIYRELERGKTGETDARFRRGYSAKVAEARINRSYRNRDRRKADQYHHRRGGAAVSAAGKGQKGGGPRPGGGAGAGGSQGEVRHLPGPGLQGRLHPDVRHALHDLGLSLTTPTCPPSWSWKRATRRP